MSAGQRRSWQRFLLWCSVNKMEELWVSISLPARFWMHSLRQSIIEYWLSIKHVGYFTYIAYLLPRTTHAHEENIHKGCQFFFVFFLDQEFSLSMQDEDLFSLELATARGERPFSQFSLLLRRPAPPWVSKMLCEPLWWWKWVGTRSLRHIKLGKILNVTIMERSLVVGCLQCSTWLWLGFNILVHVLGGAVE